MCNPVSTDEKVLVVGCGRDYSALVLALQAARGLEIVSIDTAPAEIIQRDYARLVEQFAPAKLSPQSTPYWRRFERKRRSR